MHPMSTGCAPHDTLAFLLGRWSVERAIRDHRDSVDGAFHGVASLVGRADLGIGGGAHYEEAGEMTLGSHRAPACRALDYEPLHDGSVLLRFSDGRPFVELDLRSGHCSVVHDCGADRYRIDFCVLAADLVQERWRVLGPRKDYEAVTTLTRAA
jgi:hypothetical protein